MCATRPNQWSRETVALCGAKVAFKEVGEVAKVAEEVAKVEEESEITLFNSNSTRESYEPPDNDTPNTSSTLEMDSGDLPMRASWRHGSTAKAEARR